jgi:hypothetical protein
MIFRWPASPCRRYEVGLNIRVGLSPIRRLHDTCVWAAFAASTTPRGT